MESTRAAAMTERSRPRRPGATPVVWASTLLFAALFALLTYNLSVAGSASQGASRPPLVRKVIKRRIITTIVPTPGANSVTAGPASYSSSESAPVSTGAS
jgi:hypothetical protein